ncbi:hypothetical protein OKW35_002496 [Paraburkholderia sp. MM5477-R1]
MFLRSKFDNHCAHRGGRRIPLRLAANETGGVFEAVVDQDSEAIAAPTMRIVDDSECPVERLKLAEPGSSAESAIR